MESSSTEGLEVGHTLPEGLPQPSGQYSPEDDWGGSPGGEAGRGTKRRGVLGGTQFIGDGRGFLGTQPGAARGKTVSPMQGSAAARQAALAMMRNVRNVTNMRGWVEGNSQNQALFCSHHTKQRFKSA